MTEVCGCCSRPLQEIFLNVENDIVYIGRIMYTIRRFVNGNLKLEVVK